MQRKTRALERSARTLQPMKSTTSVSARVQVSACAQPVTTRRACRYRERERERDFRLLRCLRVRECDLLMRLLEGSCSGGG